MITRCKAQIAHRPKGRLHKELVIIWVEGHGLTACLKRAIRTFRQSGSAESNSDIISVRLVDMNQLTPRGRRHEISSEPEGRSEGNERGMVLHDAPAS